MKNFFIILSIILLNFLPVFAKQISVDNLEKIFKKSIPENNKIIYTKVPRGLIISIDGRIFFDECKTEIKESSLHILDSFAEIVKDLPNRFIVEDHIRDECDSDILEPWEISMIRASNLSEYFLKCKQISNEQIFDIGFGGFMPFKDNVSPTGGAAPLNNRVDFIIIEYEANR